MSRTAVLRIPDFSILFVGRILATMSLQAQAVMVGWHVYELSKDPLLLGLIGLCEAIPAIGFAFIAGHVVDNRRPAQIYRIAVAVLVLNSLLILSTTLPGLPLSAGTSVVVLFVGVFISGMARSFTSPSVFALIAHIVPRPLLPEAAAWNSWCFQIAAIAGPALGGVLYGTCGPTIAFSFPPILMLAAFVAIQFFSRSTFAIRSESVREPFVTSIRSAVRFAVGQKVLLSSMTLDMFSVLFGGAVAILPMFSDQVLHAGSVGLGFLRSAPSFGSALVVLLMALFPLKVISGRMLLCAVGGFGLCIVGFAFSTHFVPAFIFLALSGAFDGVSMVIRNTILQLLTPQNMRGRISSLSLIFITSSNEIGAFESGVAARFLGLIPSIIFGGVMTLGIVLGTSWAAPELRATRIRPDLRDDAAT